MSGGRLLLLLLSGPQTAEIAVRLSLEARGVSDSRGGGSESADSRIADSARLVPAGGAGP